MGTVAKLSIVKGEQQDIIGEFLHRIFENNLGAYTEKTALINKKDQQNLYGVTIQQQQNIPTTIFNVRKTTYKQMNELANQWARYLVKKSTELSLQYNRDGDYIIAVCMQPSDNLVTVLMAIWKAGAAYLPIDPTFPAARIKHILREASPLLVIHDDNIDPKKFYAKPSILIGEMLNNTRKFDTTNLVLNDMFPTNNNDCIAIVLYTSGSTGIPKGVRLPHKVILNRLQWQWNTLPYGPKEDISVFKTALTFVDSVAELWSPLLSGLTVLIVPKIITKDPEQLIQLLEEYKIRRLVLVPTLLRSLLMYLSMDGNCNFISKKKKLLSDLEIWICSGEQLPHDLAMNFFDYFEEGCHTLYNFYGSTEVMGDVTYFTCKSKEQLNLFKKVPIGVPITNTVVYLLDNDHRPIKHGEIGEIFISGSNLANGYVNSRDPGKFSENYLATDLKYSRIYCTGDFGSLNNGYLMYEGRTDSQIKIRGHRVDLSEVEKSITDLSQVEKAIVLCHNPGQLDQALLGFVKLRDDSPLMGELQLENILKDKLADYMIPHVKIIDNVPLLVNGKVDRQALLKLYETANNNDGDTSVVLDYDYSDIPNELKNIAEVLFETIGNVVARSIRTTLSAKSNFYELGGNSLNSIYTVTLLREKGFNISISQFIAAKNLGQIIEGMAKCHNSNQTINLEEELWSACPHLDLEAIPLKDSYKNEIIQIIVDSFYGKADLEQWLKPNIKPSDYHDLITDIWQDLVLKGLSFVVKDKNTNRIIATSLNFDAYDEPDVVVNSKLTIIFDFLEYIEGPIREKYLPKGPNKILHAFMMGTHADLNAQENIACMHFMENEVLKLAKAKHFYGIFTTNTSPLTQQLGNEVYHYQTYLNYQINQYVYKDGSRPFAKAPDSQKVIAHWKPIK